MDLDCPGPKITSKPGTGDGTTYLQNDPNHHGVIICSLMEEATTNYAVENAQASEKVHEKESRHQENLWQQRQHGYVAVFAGDCKSYWFIYFFSFTNIKIIT